VHKAWTVPLAPSRQPEPSDAGVEIGKVYVNVAMPQRQWRVVECGKGYVKLVRIDNPNVMRFPPEEALRDRKRYRPA